MSIARDKKGSAEKTTRPRFSAAEAVGNRQGKELAATKDLNSFEKLQVIAVIDSTRNIATGPAVMRYLSKMFVEMADGMVSDGLSEHNEIEGLGQLASIFQPEG